MAIIGNIGQNRAGLTKQPIRWAAPPVNEQAQSVSKSTGLTNSASNAGQKYGPIKSVFFGIQAGNATPLQFPNAYRGTVGVPSYTFLKPAILVGAALSSTVHNNPAVGAPVGPSYNVGFMLHRDTGPRLTFWEGSDPLVEQIYAYGLVGSMRNGVGWEDADAIQFGNNEMVTIYYVAKAGGGGIVSWAVTATLRFREVI